jgi:DDE superfamily endonuclease
MPWLVQDCSNGETPIQYTDGWIDTKNTAWRDCCVGVMEATTAAPFAEREAVLQRLQQGPGPEAREETAVRTDGPPPSRWTLATIRASFESIRDYTLSGVWRWLHRRVGIELRSATVQQYSPDSQYERKLRRLKRCLRKAATDPDHVVLVFLDEMGYSVWPEAAADWCAQAPADPPLADRQKSGNGLWRIGGALNAMTGQVTYVDGYIVGRAKVIELYRRLVQTYPQADTIYVVQDNWSIHGHPQVLEAIAGYPQIEPVWLPTYAPWLNPIEKLWRWLRQDILKLHRLASDPKALRQRVNGFLDQFVEGSYPLLRYVGLLGEGQLAKTIPR